MSNTYVASFDDGSECEIEYAPEAGLFGYVCGEIYALDGREVVGDFSLIEWRDGVPVWVPLEPLLDDHAESTRLDYEMFDARDDR